jgi:hypothetical protein
MHAQPSFIITVAETIGDGHSLLNHRFIQHIIIWVHVHSLSALEMHKTYNTSCLAAAHSSVPSLSDVVGHYTDINNYHIFKKEEFSLE